MGNPPPMKGTTAATVASVLQSLASQTKGKKKTNQPKPKPQPKAHTSGQSRGSKQQSRVSGGGNKMSALNNYNVPAIMPNGKSVPFTDVVNKELEVLSTIGKVTIVAVTNLGNSSTVASVITWDTAGGLVTPIVYDMPRLNKTVLTGGPQEGRSMKYTISLCNVTENLYAGGRVHVITSNARPLLAAADPTLATVTDWTNLRDALVSMPSCKHFGGKAFDVPKTVSGFIRDGVQYENFLGWQEGHSYGNFLEHVVCDTGGAAQGAGGMSTTWMIFDRPTHHQVYNLCIRARYYLRYPQDSVMATLHQNVITASAQEVCKIVQAAENDVEVYGMKAENAAETAAAVAGIVGALG